MQALYIRGLKLSDLTTTQDILHNHNHSFVYTSAFIFTLKVRHCSDHIVFRLLLQSETNWHWTHCMFWLPKNIYRDFTMPSNIKFVIEITITYTYQLGYKWVLVYSYTWKIRHFFLTSAIPNVKLLDALDFQQPMIFNYTTYRSLIQIYTANWRHIHTLNWMTL